MFRILKGKMLWERVGNSKVCFFIVPPSPFPLGKKNHKMRFLSRCLKIKREELIYLYL